MAIGVSNCALVHKAMIFGRIDIGGAAIGRASLPTISAKALTERLDGLAQAGIVQRR